MLSNRLSHRSPIFGQFLQHNARRNSALYKAKSKPQTLFRCEAVVAEVEETETPSEKFEYQAEVSDIFMRISKLSIKLYLSSTIVVSMGFKGFSQCLSCIYHVIMLASELLTAKTII